MQTTSLALSKRLKALGVPQDSAFYYFDTLPYDWDAKWWLFYEKNDTWAGISSFLSCEIGELLPDYAVTMRTKDGWTAQIVGSDNMAFGWIDTEAEARGLLLEYLIQQGIITF